MEIVYWFYGLLSSVDGSKPDIHFYSRTIVRYKSWLSHSNKLSQSSEDGSSTLPQNDCTSSETVSQQAEQFKTPDFPLFPVSKGFCKCLERNIELFSATLVEEQLLINEETS
jgi:hypothetical protein